MNRFLVPLFFLALVGCDGLTKGAKDSQPARVAGVEPNTLKEPPPETREDLRAKAAKAVSLTLGEKRKVIDAEIAKILGAAEASQRETRLADPKVIQTLLDRTVSMIDSTNALNESLTALDRELSFAPDAYIACCAMFKQRSKSYDDADYRERCSAWAGVFEDMVVLVPAERKRVAAFAAVLPDSLKIYRETSRLLIDFSLFQSTFVDPPSIPGSKLAEFDTTYRKLLEKFKGFEAASRVYRGLPQESYAATPPATQALVAVAKPTVVVPEKSNPAVATTRLEEVVAVVPDAGGMSDLPYALRFPAPYAVPPQPTKPAPYPGSVPNLNKPLVRYPGSAGGR